MKTVEKTSINTGIYDRIGDISLNESERREATFALEAGAAIADTIAWVSDGIERMFVTSRKPDPRHKSAA